MDRSLRRRFNDLVAGLLDQELIADAIDQLSDVDAATLAHRMVHFVLDLEMK